MDGRIAITLKTDSWAAKFIKERSVDLNLPKNSTIQDLINISGIPLDEAGIAVINNEVVPGVHPLSDGDEIKIHPIIIGG